MFVIEELWYDPMENRNSYGYNVIGYVVTEDEAKAFCDKGGVVTDKEHWAFRYAGSQPKYKYKSLKRL